MSDMDPRLNDPNRLSNINDPDWRDPSGSSYSWAWIAGAIAVVVVILVALNINRDGTQTAATTPPVTTGQTTRPLTPMTPPSTTGQATPSAPSATPVEAPKQ